MRNNQPCRLCNLFAHAESFNNYIGIIPMQQSKRDIVFFLGAGFSVNAALPIMSNFGDKSRKDYEGLLKHATKPKDSKFRYAASMLIEAGELFKNFQDFCKQSRTLTKKDDEQNLETVFCIAEALHEAGIKHVELEGRLYLIDNIIEKIQLWIWKIYQQCPLLNEERRPETKPEVYEYFFKFIKELKLGKRLTVISTNYDLIYEYLSWEKGIPCMYPIEDVEWIKAGYRDDKYLFQEEHSEEQGGVVVCKLHGSINYFESNKKLFIADDIAIKGDQIGRSKVPTKRPAIFALDAIWKIRSQYGNSLTPAIIPPTYAKLGQRPWLGTIWNKAFNAIKQAQKIVFIGYSMPPSDGFIRALIHGAMATRKSNKPPQIYVIDKCEKVHKRYKKLFNSMYKPLTPQPLDKATKNNILATIFQQ